MRLGYRIYHEGLDCDSVIQLWGWAGPFAQGDTMFHCSFSLWWLLVGDHKT